MSECSTIRVSIEFDADTIWAQPFEQDLKIQSDEGPDALRPFFESEQSGRFPLSIVCWLRGHKGEVTAQPCLLKIHQNLRVFCFATKRQCKWCSKKEARIYVLSAKHTLVMLSPKTVP